MYCSTDMMTDEDKEATIKNGRVLRSDEAHVDTCNAENAQWRERRHAKGVGGYAEAQGRSARTGFFDWMPGKITLLPPESTGNKMS